MEQDEFQSDCSACAALCCLALAFDAGAQFGHDKPAGAPCRHLEGHECSIHAGLDARGYGGCAACACLGAGQRVTALYKQSWREVPKLVAPMMLDFAVMREIQTLRQMLATAAQMPLPAEARGGLEDWQARLDVDWDRAGLADFAERQVGAELRQWFKGLADHVPR